MTDEIHIAIRKQRDTLLYVIGKLVQVHDFKSFGSHDQQQIWHQARELVTMGKVEAS